MDINAPGTDKHQEDSQCPIEALPEHIQQLYLSGKSVSNLSHLVKNIIQIVSGSTEIIELGLERKQYDRVERSWGLLESNFARLKKFVLDLIKYTKHYPLQKTEGDFNQIVRNSIQSCGSILNNKDVKIELQEDKAIRPALLDTDKVEEMAANLIIHALDNLPEHVGTISITTKYLADHNQIQLSVCDNGPGLSDEAIRSLAQPHERTQNMCGTGFDIPLAKLYIEQHDGYMEFESSKPKGNCVHTYLPIQ